MQCCDKEYIVKLSQNCLIRFYCQASVKIGSLTLFAVILFRFLSVFRNCWMFKLLSHVYPLCPILPV